jgi:hypothetical protein
LATISVSLPSDGTTADVADYNTPINTIVNEFNGNIDNTNVKSGAAIATSKLADDAGITAAKITDSTLTSAKMATGFPVQMVSTSVSAASTGNTLIPNDDTIPQNTEGDQYMTQAITPKSATNILVIQATLYLSATNANDLIAALFQDSTAGALAAAGVYQATATGPGIVTILHTMTAGTTSATTFKVRAGLASAGTMTFNGSSATRRFGAITKSTIVITEYKA